MTVVAVLSSRTATQWANRIRPHLAGAVENIVAAGRELVAAKADLEHGQFETMVRDELGIDPRTARRFMSVAEHPVIANRTHVSDFPPSWGTLYELSRLEPSQLEAAIAAGDVTPSLERKAAQQLVARYRITPNSQPRPIDDLVVTDAPPTTYGVIVADPPWRYGNTSTRGAAEDHYPTMTQEELVRLSVEVDEWAAPDSHLYLWVTNNFLRDGLDLVEAWGFTYRTLLTWVKPQIGMGNYFRSRTEHVLFATRGHAPTLRRDISNVIGADRTQHSRKPDAFYDLVEAQSPGPYLEMFARRRRFGWESWGNEA